MRLGVRQSQGLPFVRFEGATCYRCGEEIWVPVGLQGGPLCATHTEGTQAALGSYEHVAETQANLLRLIIQQTNLE